jgi:hypothetical protein
MFKDLLFDIKENTRIKVGIGKIKNKKGKVSRGYFTAFHTERNYVENTI